MTIAIVSMIRDPWGGSEELWYDMAKVAVRQGHKVLHLRYEHPIVAPKIKELQSLGVSCLERPGYIPPGAVGVRSLAAVGKNYIRKKIRPPFFSLFAAKPDVVIYNGTCYSIGSEKVLMDEVLKSKTSFFILGHLNADLTRGITESEAERVRIAYKASKRVFFVSQRSMQNAERHLCMSFRNGQIVKNPVNLETVTDVPFPTLSDTPQFALVGNLVTGHKGQDILLHALSGKNWKERNWNLNIYGSGNDEHYLRQLCRHFGLEEKVVFHGRVKDVREIWQVNHMLLMPSLMEGMPLAIVEAMLCGRPSLVTDVGGNAEWVEAGKSGFVAPVASVQALAVALEQAWSAIPKWSEMGQAARQRALALYDPNAGLSFLETIKEIHES